MRCIGRACRPWVSGAWLLASLCSGAQAQMVAGADDVAADRERHKIADGDTLSQVAERFLGSAEAWPKLWSWNPEITNPHWIYPGYVVRLKEGVDLGTGDAAGVANAPVLVGRRSVAFLRTARGRAAGGPGTVLIGEEVYLDRDALTQAGRIVGSREERMLLSPTDEVYLQFGKQSAVPEVGKECTVFLRLHRAEVFPGPGKTRRYMSGDGGEIVRVLGGLKIVSYDAEKRIARATVTEALDPLERGFEVADVPRRLEHVAAKPNAREVKGQIVGTARALSTLGDGQVVFIDAGSKQGVDVGNRFLVMRQGDAWRQKLTVREERTGATRPDPAPLSDTAYPAEMVAELRVLYVRPETSTALIVMARRELAPGDHVEMHQGD